MSGGPGPIESAGGGWTTETILAHLTSSLDDVEKRLLVQIEANDTRYQQRFFDAQTAVNTAMAAAEKAVAAALEAQKEAVGKAEAAAEKRFESVNEFRGTLSDQQRLLIPRIEAELRFAALENKLDAAVDTLQAAVALNAARIAEKHAQDAGAKDHSIERRARATDQRLVAGFVLSLIVAAIAVVGLVIKLTSGTP